MENNYEPCQVYKVPFVVDIPVDMSHYSDRDVPLYRPFWYNTVPGRITATNRVTAQWLLVAGCDRLAGVQKEGATPETLYHRDDALLYITYVMRIWAAPIPADRWHCSLWP